MDLFSGTLKVLGQSLDAAAAKNNVISANIANVDTPNYKAKDVTFKNMLQNASIDEFQAKRTNSKHLSFDDEMNTYKIVEKNNTSYNHNGNNVDIDREMAELGKNQIYYQSLVERMNGKFRDLETVLKGGN
ncbi:flagellar basal body rod protein FlgB [Virgibacillus halophilus]|uniref:Flagellar basal body rod protein FlgB n=1 Tax=Tigheibacillus halophilus TaxID=361280 RepID=A0ABU5CAL1_9BACI|nr:flagellar basal body rod protein FlgB [Virgibacillus halophilus]